MKRSRFATLVFMSASPILLSSCSDPEPDQVTFKTVNDCIQSKQFSVETCNQEFAHAQQAYKTQAPHFKDQASCEAQYGPQTCMSAQRSDGSSWFMPAMTGFMIGHLLNNNNCNYPNNCSSGYRSTPYYGSWPAGNRGWYSSSSKTSSSSTATTNSRGGFGSSAAARGGWGS